MLGRRECSARSNAGAVSSLPCQRPSRASGSEATRCMLTVRARAHTRPPPHALSPTHTRTGDEIMASAVGQLVKPAVDYVDDNFLKPLYMPPTDELLPVRALRPLADDPSIHARLCAEARPSVCRRADRCDRPQGHACVGLVERACLVPAPQAASAPDLACPSPSSASTDGASPSAPAWTRSSRSSRSMQKLCSSRRSLCPPAGTTQCATRRRIRVGGLVTLPCAARSRCNWTRPA